MNDIWHPPITDPVVGLVLHDSWYDPRVLGSVNVQGGWTDSAQITQDGRYLAFSYSMYDFNTWYHTGQELLTGPSRAGQAEKFRNFYADIANDGLVGVADGNPTDPTTGATSSAINASGNVFVQSWWPNGGASHIMIQFLVNGVWSVPTELPYPINSYVANCYAEDAYAVGSPGSFRLYFESKRLDAMALSGGSRARMWRCDYTTAGGYTTPVLVPGLSTSLSDDSQFSVHPDGVTAYWSSSRNGVNGIFSGTLNGNNPMKNVHAVATISYVAPYTGRIVMLGEATVARNATTQLMYFMGGIAANADASVIDLRLCVMRKGAA